MMILLATCMEAHIPSPINDAESIQKLICAIAKALS